MSKWEGRAGMYVGRITSVSFMLVILCLCLARCSQNEGIVIPDEPFQKLSQYGFFEGELSDLLPHEGVVPYDLQSPLFSDYSYKTRFVWMPNGTAANYTQDHVLDFPKGAVLIKSFYYPHDERDLSLGRHIVETRVLINRGEAWDAYGYIWDEDQQDAKYTIVGDIKDLSWIDKEGETRHVPYIIPNKNQCKSCHSYKEKLMPIGPKVRNLNKDYAYASGTQNQLAHWQDIGYLNGLTLTDAPAVAKWDNSNHDIHDRAMAYLDINCGHCHNPDGAGHTSGLTLLADSQPGLKLGIYKPSVAAGAGTGGHTYGINPGDPETSIMVYRMSTDNPGAMMPEVGRQLVHDEGVTLISEWIKQLPKEDFDHLLDVGASD